MMKMDIGDSPIPEPVGWRANGWRLVEALDHKCSEPPSIRAGWMKPDT
jgi:hypothetical protein